MICASPEASLRSLQSLTCSTLRCQKGAGGIRGTTKPLAWVAVSVLRVKVLWLADWLILCDQLPAFVSRFSVPDLWGQYLSAGRFPGSCWKQSASATGERQKPHPSEISPVGQTVQGHQTRVPPGSAGLGISENLALLFPLV